MTLTRFKTPPVQNEPKPTFGGKVYGESGKGDGPIVWCKRCSRKHRRRAVCRLFLRTRVAKSGRKVKRWCH